jgi:hypothetical protein
LSPANATDPNKRLSQVGYLWTFSLLTALSGTRAHYDRRHNHGDTYAAAKPNLANRYFGILFQCLQHHEHYDETKDFRQHDQAAA